MVGQHKRVMIVDALNIFLRAYIKDPSLCVNGTPIGGIRGFFRILQRLVRENEPNEVVVCWDGRGGSKKRKKIFKEYKEGRRPLQLNRSYDRSEQEDLENKIWQQTRIFEYLNELPISQLLVDSLEADDLIAFLVKSVMYEDYQKIIISSDKDFYQLCDNKTVIYRPNASKGNTYYTINKLLEEFNIHPNNFALARAMEGDKSDNIDGIKGVGIKTVAKRLPFLAEEKQYLMEEVFDYCKDNIKGSSFYEKVLQNKEKIKRNYQVMQLYLVALTPHYREQISWQIDNFDFSFNKLEIMRLIDYDGIANMDIDELLRFCAKINKENKAES